MAQKDFFLRTKGQLQVGTWDQFIAKLSCADGEITARSFRRWRLGKALPPRGLIERINNLTDQKLRGMTVTIRPGDWGQRKGGLVKFALCGCNLTLRDRVKGGTVGGKLNSLHHLWSIGSLGGANPTKSGRNPRRKVLGPDGKMMYNILEKQCFAALLQAGFAVEYEPVVIVGKRRIIPDFRIGNVYVECTGDPKVFAKAGRFLEKFRLLEKYEEAWRAIVVTLPHLVERYRLRLGRRAFVTTKEGLVDSIVSGW